MRIGGLSEVGGCLRMLKVGIKAWGKKQGGVELHGQDQKRGLGENGLDFFPKSKVFALRVSSDT